jgi:hypothetical protein
MGTDKLSFAEDRWGSDHCACLTGRGPVRKYVLRMRIRKLRNIRPSGAFFIGSDKITWTEEALSGLTFFPVLFVSRTFPPLLFFPYFFFRTIFPYFFFRFFPRFLSRTIFPYSFFSYYFTYFVPVFFSPVLFCSRTFSKVATFEIQRFKISVSCFSSTCRYNTVHVHCGISNQTSPVGLPLDGWGASMRDLKGPKMNLFNLKEDWNVLLYQPIISLEIEPIRSRYFQPISQSDCKNWTNQKRADL